MLRLRHEDHDRVVVGLWLRGVVDFLGMGMSVDASERGWADGEENLELQNRSLGVN
jgi:hypothetical protein